MRFARRGHGPIEDPPERRKHGGGGRHLARFFAHGDLRLVILHLIAERPRHGYELIKSIEDSLAGAYTPSPGVIYPTLTLLEELGYASAAADGAKKLYSITSEGQAFLTANRTTLDALISRITEAGAVRAGGRLPAIVRAMEDLKLALRQRMSRGAITDEQIDAIAAAINTAARKVEQT